MRLSLPASLRYSTTMLAVNIADYFAKHGALDPAVGQAFRDKILSRGYTKDQMDQLPELARLTKQKRVTK